MGLQHKFGALFVGVNLLLPSFAHSLVLESLKIDSSRGEPLYAEIPFRNAQSQSPIKVSIAQPFEVGQMSVLDPEKFAHLNFYVRQNAQGNGVIVITSSRAITESAIDLMLKIEDAGQVRMQSVNTKLPSRIERLQNNLQDIELKPRFVANEKDIQLNLPVSSTLVSPSTVRGEQQLQIQASAPPPLHTKSNLNAEQKVPDKKSNQIVIPSPTTQSLSSGTENAIKVASPQPPIRSNTITATKQNLTPTVNTLDTNLTIKITQHPIANRSEPATPKTVQNTAKIKTPSNEVKAAPAPAQIKNNTTQTSSAAMPSQHTVKANETLWGIAQQIASTQNVSTQHVMQHILQANPSAFIQGNANRLKQGAILSLPSNYLTTPTQQQNKPTSAQQVTQPSETQKTSKQVQAHMSIVGNTHQGTVQGSQEKVAGSNNLQNELTIELKSQRGSTLDLQNNVKNLDQQLKQKERRIALLNSRLAELEQQLKNKKKTSSSSSSNTTSKVQGVIPALDTGKITTLSNINADLAITTLLQELV